MLLDVLVERLAGDASAQPMDTNVAPCGARLEPVVPGVSVGLGMCIAKSAIRTMRSFIDDRLVSGLAQERFGVEAHGLGDPV
jgi:hypothetical protein